MVLVLRMTPRPLFQKVFLFVFFLFVTNHHQTKTASALTYDIPCGDTDMFNATMYAVVPGDVVLLDGNACVYDFGPDYDLERDRVYTSTGDRLFGDEDGIIIKGKGQKPEDTILRLYISSSFGANVVFEKLTLESNNYYDDGSLMELDSDAMYVFRNCILKSSPELGTTGFTSAIVSYSARIALIYSELINGGTNKQNIGLEADYHAYLLGSEISGFGVGLEAWDFEDTIVDPNDYYFNTFRVFDSDLSQNDIGKNKTSFKPILLLTHHNNKK